MEPETVKDAECQIIEFHYMFQTSRCEAQKEAFKEIYDIVCFYTGLPYMEILMVFFFEPISWYVTLQTQSLNRFQEFIKTCAYET